MDRVGIRMRGWRLDGQHIVGSILSVYGRGIPKRHDTAHGVIRCIESVESLVANFRSAETCM